MAPRPCMNNDLSSNTQQHAATRSLFIAHGLSGSFKADVSSSSSNFFHASSEPYLQIYQAEIDKLKQQLEFAHATAQEYLSTVKTLQKEVPRMEKLNEEFRTKNDELINDVQQIVDENKELNMLLKSTIEEKCLFQRENNTLVEERSALKEKLKMKQDKLLDHDEVSELVEQTCSQMKRKLKTSISQQVRLQSEIHKLKSENHDVYDTMESIFQEMKKRIQAKDEVIKILMTRNDNKDTSSEVAKRQGLDRTEKLDTQAKKRCSIPLGWSISKRLSNIFTSGGPWGEINDDEKKVFFDEKNRISLVATEQLLNGQC
mmetsp:Transcript_28859/g.42747  ORF Transcript_28859/g.42747 Transcript_28859/m.42747 type:complete len:316 (-) Transcript_28859:115-1062(-)